MWVSFAIAAAAFLIASAIRFRPVGSGNSSFSNPLPAVPLTGNPGYEAFPTFSPEGTRVAFAWDEVGKHALNINVKLIGSGDPVRLTRSSNGDFGPAWSPDGHSIAFLRARDPFHATIVIVPSIGGVERELTDIGFDNHSALQVWKSLQVPPPFLAWSGNGKWLLAIEQRAHGETNSVVRVSVETGEKRALTLPPKHVVGDGGLALSPDSGKLAFARNVGALERDIYLILLSPDMLPKGEPKRITFDRKEIDGLAWTADGHRLVFSSRRSGRRELWELSLTSPNTYARLPAAGDDPLDVAISREGKHLVYSHQVLDWDIWRLSLNGKAGEQAQSIISSTRLEYHPTYSPDGKRIAFESNRSGNEEIWTSAADGSNAIQLTTFRNLWAGSPRWSPDGRKIAFDADAAGNWDIYVISSQGGEPARLTTNRAEEFRPSWSGDGKWIYYCSSRSGHAQVWKVPAGGGKEAQVTRNGGRIAFESSDGEDLYYTKDEGGLWKMPVRGGSETKVLDSINQQNFAPTKHGVYFLEDSAGLQNALSLRLLEPKTHVIRTIAKLPGPVGDEICVSPDEQSMLFYKPGREGSELMIIENFR